MAGLVALIASAGMGCDDGGGTGGDSGGTESNGPGTGQTTSTSGNDDGVCTPEDGRPVSPVCGVFVNANAATSGTGNQDAPVKTLTEALAKASDVTTPIYVCGSLDESVTLTAGRVVHGEIVCDGSWTWDLSTRADWTAPSDEIPLRTEGGVSPTIVTGFRVVPRNSVVPGGSSIGVLANGGRLELARTDVVTGAGAAGTPGSNGAAGFAGGNGQPGATQENSISGGGGDSTCGADGGNGANSVCPANPPCMQVPAGPPGYGGSSGNTTCSHGLDGDAVGLPGGSGTAASMGSIDADGFVPDVGGMGQTGGNGVPGGGGGAEWDNEWYGGGGGAGGCGGKGSGGGQSGGSSFAFVSLDAVLVFDQVTAAVGNGGAGGNPGVPGQGGAGGLGGAGGCDAGVTLCLQPEIGACDGGAGAPGGAGGAGGGGRGGHAAIIAYVGIVNELTGLTAAEPAASQAGSGGTGALDGEAVVELEFQPPG